MAGADFDSALKVVLKWEGGLVDDPDDPGGVTNHGISIRFAGSIGLDIDGDGKTTRADIVDLTEEDAREIYQREFWMRLRCGSMPRELALCVFDCAVNQGTGAAARLLQRAACVKVDGIVGPKTIQACWERDTYEILLDFMARRAKRYADTRGVEKYGRGWYRRLFDVHRHAVRRGGF